MHSPKMNSIENLGNWECAQVHCKLSLYIYIYIWHLHDCVYCRQLEVMVSPMKQPLQEKGECGIESHRSTNLILMVDLIDHFKLAEI